MARNVPQLLPALEQFLSACTVDFKRISPGRRADLERVAEYIRACVDDDRPARLVFICTHNSRRSHMAQIWAQAAAAHHGVGGVQTYSGGTEATAFAPHAVTAMQAAGFGIEMGEPPQNPRYRVRYAIDTEPMEVFSKVVDAEPNPRRDFVAVMTCSSADAACPNVAGASLRVAIPYEDPKAADGTAQEARVYDERCREIGVEMAYLFAAVKS